MSIECQGYFFIFLVLYVLCFTRPRHQVSVYRTTGPLVYVHDMISDLLIRIKLIQNMEIDFLFAAVKPHLLIKLN